MKKTVCLLLGISLVFFGCKNEENVEKSKMTFEQEMDILTSEQELNFLLSRSGEGIVDWQLSREFAEMLLEEFIACGEFPADSTLWEIPVSVYDADGTIRYYEFRVMNDENVIAAIVGNAREDLGGPISRVFEMTGYSDELTNLYNAGKLTENEVPRIVDNDYPNYAIAKSVVTKSGSVSYSEIINPQTGEEETDWTKVLTVEEMIEKSPENFSESEIKSVDSAIADYKEEIEELWKMAKASKGNLSNLAFKGSKKNPRTAVDESRIKATNEYALTTKNIGSKYSYYKKIGKLSYGACGATAAGFLLDFIQANSLGATGSWKDLSYDERVASLIKKMKITTKGIKNITAPHNLGNAVKDYTDYKVSLALGVVPNTSIENNLPGINLRGLDCSSWDAFTGGLHYRNVVAYREDGWWIFKWSSIKVHDGNNVDGGWETYNPFYHLFSYNLVKK